MMSVERLLLNAELGRLEEEVRRLTAERDAALEALGRQFLRATPEQMRDFFRHGGPDPRDRPREQWIAAGRKACGLDGDDTRPDVSTT
jgi:hypothetical protein